jgi:hypothetical protein
LPSSLPFLPAPTASHISTPSGSNPLLPAAHKPTSQAESQIEQGNGIGATSSHDPDMQTLIDIKHSFVCGETSDSSFLVLSLLLLLLAVCFWCPLILFALLLLNTWSTGGANKDVNSHQEVLDHLVQKGRRLIKQGSLMKVKTV